MSRRDRRPDLEAAVGARAGGERAAARLDALAHAGQAAPAAVAGRLPAPSSRTITVTRPGSHRSRTVAVAPGPTCLSTFVNASCATR